MPSPIAEAEPPQEKLKEEEYKAAEPEKRLEEKRKELVAVEEKAHEKLEKVYEAKRVSCCCVLRSVDQHLLPTLHVGTLLAGSALTIASLHAPKCLRNDGHRFICPPLALAVPLISRSCSLVYCTLVMCVQEGDGP